MKSLLVAVFSLCAMVFTNSALERFSSMNPTTNTEEKKSAFDANEVIFGHVLDAHEFHFFSYKGSDGREHHATIPLPVILYSPQKVLMFLCHQNFIMVKKLIMAMSF